MKTKNYSFLLVIGLFDDEVEFGIGDFAVVRQGQLHLKINIKKMFHKINRFVDEYLRQN